MGRAFAILLLIVFALFFVVPLVWLLIAPTKTDRQLLLEAPFAFGSVDTLVANWSSLVTFQGGLIWTWIGNSAFYCLAALAISLVVSIPAGYALALTEFRGRRALLVATLIVMLVPSTALVLPIFLELSAVKLIGNPLAAILPFSFFPFGVYLTYIYFSTAISRDLLDAARIDGASEVQVFMRIAMPLATPVIALVGFFNFTGNWNNYFLPYVTLPGRKAPIQVG
ncbi:MAG: carbohydrate ABC transporter permease, partial [Devosia sp.]|nr:carbohydrate ABC transporter permease [Devosia sp.]